MVGQETAWEAAGLVVRMIKEGKLSGKAIGAASKSGCTEHAGTATWESEGGRCERMGSLFMDIGEAAEHLKKYEEKLMKH